jgi:hypothetical protein
MKKILFILMFSVTAMSCGDLGQVLSTTGDILSSGALSSKDAAAGIKQALEFGVLNGTSTLGRSGGFLKNAAYQILMPKEVRNFESKIRSNPIANALAGAYLDKVKTSMNTGAEKAMAQAKPIFVNAIRRMTITDAVNIVTGRDGGATDFLKKATLSQLTAKFTPVIGNSLNSVGIAKPWSQVSKAYNMVAGKQVNTDLTNYVTARATDGLFKKIREEEHDIRVNPAKRTTDILKKVFAFSGKG